MAAANLTISTAHGIDFDADLIRKMKQSGPRYTSYPTADQLSTQFTSWDYLHAVASVRVQGARPLSLYIHIPFCDTICYYCACNKIVTKDRSKAATYLGYLKQEIEMQGKLFSGINQVEQLHFGGGTPTYLNEEQMDDLLAHIRRWFKLASDEVGEYSIEVDPRTVTPQRVRTLRHQGFNRISLGVQDFEPEVQEAVNRIQPEEETVAIIDAARGAGFRSVSIDLIYGLPKQTVASMERTLIKVIAASPDRIAIYNYAHLPHLFKPQRRINESDLPSADSKLDMLHLCITRLTAAGYVYIGMDHFAKPTDDLAIAQQQGRLHRNFQGYSTHADADMIACGVSAISTIGTTYSQNEKTLDAYYARLDQGELPMAKGLRLNMDDLIRRAVIQSLMCHFEVSFSLIELSYPIVFSDYFADELAELRQFQLDGLIQFENDCLCVTDKGRLLIRNICMVFDHYLRDKKNHPPAETIRFSTTI